MYPYYYKIGVGIVHMMLMSWAGNDLDDPTVVLCTSLED